MSDATWVEGRIEHVLWAAEDGGWAVLRVRTGASSVIVVGPLGALAGAADEAPFASFEGTFQQHPSHGWQFRATGVLVGSPRTVEGIRLYLASSRIHGIGPRLADRIVHHFGLETTTVLEEAPERLVEVSGVGEEKARAIAEAWAADAGGRALSILLRSLGVTARLVGRIRERYGDEAYRVVTKEPYRLAEEVSGIGFRMADQIARNQGMALDHPDRIAAAVRHVVSRATDDGHCYLPAEAIAEGVSRLDVPVPDLPAVLDRLVAEARLMEVGDGSGRAVAVPLLAEREGQVAVQLVMRAQLAPDPPPDATALADAEAWAKLSLDEAQRHAVTRSASHAVSVITGGPGTGKTTIVRVLLRLAAERGERWLLASPTGRAAKRLAEATGQEASTLHRLLEFQPGGASFGRNAMHPLEADGVLVDEVSMVDIKLMAALMDALPWENRCRLVLVGDADQLPSVGPGQVLRDLVNSQEIPVSRLKTVHRQGARSGIVVAAAAIHGGEVPASGEHVGHDDFFLVPREDAGAAASTVVEIVAKRLAERGFDPSEDVQVLAPTRKGPLGTESLNQLLRDAINPSTSRLSLRGQSYGEGDRVICTKNRYDHGVFNGDLGRVLDVRKEGLRIRFDTGVVMWPRDELDQIELAYAVTVHKSQGSEYPAVVLALHRSHSIMLRKNLFYTAVTRARQFFVGVGDPGAWARAVRVADSDARFTRLARLMAEEAVVEASLGRPASPGEGTRDGGGQDLG